MKEQRIIHMHLPYLYDEREVIIGTIAELLAWLGDSLLIHPVDGPRLISEPGIVHIAEYQHPAIKGLLGEGHLLICPDSKHKKFTFKIKSGGKIQPLFVPQPLPLIYYDKKGRLKASKELLMHSSPNIATLLAWRGIKLEPKIWAGASIDLLEAEEKSLIIFNATYRELPDLEDFEKACRSGKHLVLCGPRFIKDEKLHHE